MAKPTVCTHGNPPWHTILLVFILFVFVFQSLPTLESLDEVANAGTFTRRVLVTSQDGVERPLLTVRQLAAIRLLVGILVVCDTLYAFLWATWEQNLTYFPGSKLTALKSLSFTGALRGPRFSVKGGLRVLSCFTMWAWITLGVSFTTMGIIPLFVQSSVDGTAGNLQPQPPSFVHRAAYASWSIAAPTSLLVSVVVKYVLWPTALQMNEGRKTAVMYKHVESLLEHNLNSIAVLVEIALLGGAPLRLNDMAMAPLLGLIYVLFSYCMRHQWCDTEVHGPQFLYPLLDTTLPGVQPSIILLCLLMTLILSHGCLSGVSYLLSAMSCGITTRLATVAVGALLVCRFRD